MAAGRERGIDAKLAKLTKDLRHHFLCRHAGRLRSQRTSVKAVYNAIKNRSAPAHIGG